jgi:hypothetical protein
MSNIPFVGLHIPASLLEGNNLEALNRAKKISSKPNPPKTSMSNRSIDPVEDSSKGRPFQINLLDLAA